MCGIIGAFSTSKNNLIKSVKDAREKLNHRGPDDRGLEVFQISRKNCNELSGSLVLGHTRLSILDLSQDGQQPMCSKDRRYVITFNGEIYNYKELRVELESKGFVFKSDSDTEVLLKSWEHWGEESLKRLVGMFAFVVYDNEKNSLTMVRDAFGIKPLFYAKENDYLAFASETSALLELMPSRPTPNWQTAFNYLTSARVDRREDTFYEGIKQLLPGHLLEIDLKSKIRISPKRWWYPSIKENSNLTFEESKEFLREKFLNNVRLQLRSDVPLGAALSGGIDSTAVVCAMRRLEPTMEIKTFSYISRDSSKNEEKWVDIVNEYVRAKSYKIQIHKSDIFNDLDTLIKIQGEPFGSPSIYGQYRVFKKISESGVKANLDGQGADELLAGYFGYPHARFKSLIAQKDIFKIWKLFKGLRKNFNQYPKREFLQALFKRFEHHFISKRAEQFGERYLNQMFSDQFTEERLTCSNLNNYRELTSHLRDALTGKKGLVNLLRYEDRNSMIHSIESRVPFLTIDMAEFVLSLPENFLLSDEGVTKYVFREAMRGIVPDEILDRKDKIGFETPDNQWLLAEKTTISKWLKEFDQIPILDSFKAIKFYESLCIGTNRDFLGFWRLINFHKWYEQNNF
jgi:asparagine synthase (glutamine-hydrolysing)